MPADERLMVDVVTSFKAMTVVLTCADSEGGLSSKTFLVANIAFKENIRDAFEYAAVALSSRMFQPP